MLARSSAPSHQAREDFQRRQTRCAHTKNPSTLIQSAKAACTIRNTLVQVPHASEHKTQRHLINSRAEDIALVPSCRDERAEVRRRGVVSRINVRVVWAGDHVEGFGAKLRLEALPDAEV